jgi:hypothetical protein
MKTPMQELIEVLKIHRDTAFEKSRMYESEHYHSRGQAFEDAISFAELQLEKEKEVMCEFAEEYVGSCLIDYPKIKIIFDQTFNN